MHDVKGIIEKRLKNAGHDKYATYQNKDGPWRATLAGEKTHDSDCDKQHLPGNEDMLNGIRKYSGIDQQQNQSGKDNNHTQGVFSHLTDIFMFFFVWFHGVVNLKNYKILNGAKIG